jgi:hypothetical protein
VDDVWAIEQLHYRYAWGFDGEKVDPDAVASCFTADARWYSDGQNVELHGRDEIRRFSAGHNQRVAQCLHYITNLRVTVADDGDSATASAYLWYVAVRVGSEAPFHLTGTYEGTCVKHRGEWLFSELLIKRRLAFPAVA